MSNGGKHTTETNVGLRGEIRGVMREWFPVVRADTEGVKTVGRRFAAGVGLLLLGTKLPERR